MSAFGGVEGGVIDVHVGGGGRGIAAIHDAGPRGHKQDRENRENVESSR